MPTAAPTKPGVSGKKVPWDLKGWADTKLAGLDVGQLRELCTTRGIKVASGAHKSTYADKLLEWKSKKPLPAPAMTTRTRAGTSAAATVPFNDAFIKNDTKGKGDGYVTGKGHIQQMVELVQRLKTAGVKFWIGKTSKGNAGLRSRWDQKYKAGDPEMGHPPMKHAAIIYRGSGEDAALEVETALFTHFRKAEPRFCLNTETHGDYKRGAPGPFSVYLMWS